MQFDLCVSDADVFLRLYTKPVWCSWLCDALLNGVKQHGSCILCAPLSFLASERRKCFRNGWRGLPYVVVDWRMQQRSKLPEQIRPTIH